MYLNSTYSLQSIADVNFIFMRNSKQIDLTRIISFNDSAAWLWMQLEGREFTYDDVVSLIVEHYDIDHSTASADVKGWLEELVENDLLRE